MQERLGWTWLLEKWNIAHLCITAKSQPTSDICSPFGFEKVGTEKKMFLAWEYIKWTQKGSTFCAQKIKGIQKLRTFCPKKNKVDKKVRTFCVHKNKVDAKSENILYLKNKVDTNLKTSAQKIKQTKTARTFCSQKIKRTKKAMYNNKVVKKSEDILSTRKKFADWKENSQIVLRNYRGQKCAQNL